MLDTALILPMACHVLWSTLLYGMLTIARAPDVWKIGAKADGSNPWVELEPRISANLSNQFEWPLLFYVVCLLLIVSGAIEPHHEWLAWTFVGGRILHSGVQILTTNLRLRGAVFTISFLAVLCLWLTVLQVAYG